MSCRFAAATTCRPSRPPRTSPAWARAGGFVPASRFSRARILRRSARRYRASRASPIWIRPHARTPTRPARPPESPMRRRCATAPMTWRPRATGPSWRARSSSSKPLPRCPPPNAPAKPWNPAMSRPPGRSGDSGQPGPGPASAGRKAAARDQVFHGRPPPDLPGRRQSLRLPDGRCPMGVVHQQ